PVPAPVPGPAPAPAPVPVPVPVPAPCPVPTASLPLIRSTTTPAIAPTTSAATASHATRFRRAAIEASVARLARLAIGEGLDRGEVAARAVGVGPAQRAAVAIAEPALDDRRVVRAGEPCGGELAHHDRLVVHTVALRRTGVGPVLMDPV